MNEFIDELPPQTKNNNTARGVGIGISAAAVPLAFLGPIGWLAAGSIALIANAANTEITGVAARTFNEDEIKRETEKAFEKFE